MELTVRPKQPFSFKATIFSHGWIDLPPFKYEANNSILYTSIPVGEESIRISLTSSTDTDIKIKAEQRLSDEDSEAVHLAVEKMFRLRENYDPFYALAAQSTEYEWILQKKAGRLFRCNTLWEDMVKMLCTTNCTWNLTRIMVGNLVDIVGNGIFPSPDKVAEKSEEFLRQKIKMGYRAPYLLDLSRNIVAEKIKLEQFENWSQDTPALYKELKHIRGFGHYAVAGLLKLLGHYTLIGSDSWSRKKFAGMYGYDNNCTEEEIYRHYQDKGQWAGLFFWMDVTKDWYDKDPFM